MAKPTKATKKTKTITGKSAIERKMPTYKPSIYLDDKQIPKDMDKIGVGKTIQMLVTGKIVSTTERQDKGGKNHSMSIEIDKIKTGK